MEIVSADFKGLKPLTFCIGRIQRPYHKEQARIGSSHEAKTIPHTPSRQLTHTAFSLTPCAVRLADEH
jgi:hypothetical protein